MNDRSKVTYLPQACSNGLAFIVGEGKNQKIKYKASDRSEKYSDPEELVRAEFWAELIYRYNYDPKRIGFEIVVPRRTPNDWADLVIYKDDELKQPYAVIECKKDGISDAEFAQAIEQACGNRASLGAPFSGVVSGSTRRFFDFSKQKPQERQKNIIADLPARYGKPPEYRFYKGLTGQDLSAIPRDELRTVIRKCHQTLWEGGKRSPIAAFGEFSKIIFVKIRDEKNAQRKKGEPYAFQRRTEEAAEELAQRVHALYEVEQKREPGVFKGRIDVDHPVLAQVVEHLESISLSQTDLDTKGVAFEEFMGGFFKGDFGQYFTPRELIAFAVEMMKPQRDEFVLDPACGSGGFLLHALEYIRREAERRYPNWKTDADQREQYREYWHEFARSNLFGLEVNDELARVAKMNMIIHDDGHSNIVENDALDFLKNLKEKNRKLKFDFFDLVLTNPPFGSVIKRTEKADGYIEQYELRHYLGKSTTGTEPDEEVQSESDAKRGEKAVKQRSSVKTEILFLERVCNFLKPGTGRVAIVLPDGILTNSSLQGVRDWILERFQILAVVGLPQFAFQHYDAGVKASIVFLRKLSVDEQSNGDDPIFMALASNIGYDATGRKTFDVVVEKEESGVKKVEIHRCDLFDYRVYYEWSITDPKKPDWSERHREVVANTGIAGQYHAFQKDPNPFFV
ncbi:MAG: N-6 DNA methylase [Ignavibacteriales bacterium]|nr:N-6 DNA methylase [Ignavibacteriales bacterium]